MKVSFKISALILLFICLCASQALAASFSGKLVKVIDGDTVDVMHGKRAERIRLAQIDCPEQDQPFGQAAKRFVLNVAAHQIVTVQIETIDRYGRTVGEVFLPDGSNLNKRIVGAGYAWQYKRYSKDPAYADLEAGARVARLGLWQDKNPVPPWEWRRGQRAGSANKVAIGAYHGNTRSRVFHKSNCRHYNCKNCSKGFTARKTAIEAGYRPCGSCRP